MYDRCISRISTDRNSLQRLAKNQKTKRVLNRAPSVRVVPVNQKGITDCQGHGKGCRRGYKGGFARFAGGIPFFVLPNVRQVCAEFKIQESRLVSPAIKSQDLMNDIHHKISIKAHMDHRYGEVISGHLTQAFRYGFLTVKFVRHLWTNTQALLMPSNQGIVLQRQSK